MRAVSWALVNQRASVRSPVVASADPLTGQPAMCQPSCPSGAASKTTRGGPSVEARRVTPEKSRISSGVRSRYANRYPSAVGAAARGQQVHALVSRTISSDQPESALHWAARTSMGALAGFGCPSNRRPSSQANMVPRPSSIHCPNPCSATAVSPWGRSGSDHVRPPSVLWTVRMP